uniref:Mechanosensitive ion channel family protein n=1 Tax=Macrostomum lignano TaxID=282301 RepID=A0A1I8HZQ3_9PLAT
TTAAGAATTAATGATATAAAIDVSAGGAGGSRQTGPGGGRGGRVKIGGERARDAEARADKTDREVAALAQKLRNLPSSDSQQLQTMLEDYRRETMRRVTDTDERMQSLSTKLDKLTDKVDTNANLNLATLLRELTEKFDDSIKWQELVKGQITAVQNRQNATDD